VWITSFSVGGAIGPLAGGLVLKHFWWGAVFLLGVPVMALLLAVGPVLLPESRDSKAGRLDLTSAALSLAAVLTVIYGFKQIAEGGLEWLPVLSILAGLAIGVVFMRRQRKLADPLIDLQLFRLPAFSASLATTILSFFTSFGAFLFIAQYLQLVLGLSPLQAGLWTLPQSAGFILGSLLASVIVRRVRPAFVMTAGLALAAAGCGVLTKIDDIYGLTILVIGSILLSLGLAPVVTLATDLIVGAAPPERAGAASAISETSSEFGGALGIAILGSVGAAVYRSVMADTTLTWLPPEAADAARGTLGGALAASGRLPDHLAAELLSTARNAFVQAFELTAAIGAVGLLITAIMAAVMLRGARSNAEFPAQPELEHDDGQSQETSGSSLIFQGETELSPSRLAVECISKSAQHCAIGASGVN
jgi:DHA2 family multidrug resistance protein-like MFS transporter